MLRKLRPWWPVIAFAALVVVLEVARLCRTPPSAPPPPQAPPAASAEAAAEVPLPPGPSIGPEKLPAYMENVLRARGMNVRVVPCDGRPGFYDLYAGPLGLPDEARPLALVEVRPGEASPPTLALPGDYRVGPYHVVGNPALVTRVRQAFPSWGG